MLILYIFLLSCSESLVHVRTGQMLGGWSQTIRREKGAGQPREPEMPPVNTAAGQAPSPSRSSQSWGTGTRSASLRPSGPRTGLPTEAGGRQSLGTQSNRQTGRKEANADRHTQHTGTRTGKGAELTSSQHPYSSTPGPHLTNLPI